MQLVTRTVNLRSLFSHTHLPTGVGLTISVTKADTNGRVFLLSIRAGKKPSYRATCLAPGSSALGKSC